MEPGLIPVLYAGAALLAAFAAASELMARFKDEPFKVLLKGPALAYLALNVALAAVVLFGLRWAETPEKPLMQIEQVLLAGFGARVLVRSKVVGFKGKDGAPQEVGPGAFFEQILTSISREIDRDRAAERLAMVSRALEGVEWDKARLMFVAEMAGAMQDLTEAEKTKIQGALDVMEERTDLDDGARTNLLGYLVINYGGEEFLDELVRLYWKRFPKGAPAPAPAPPATAPSST